MITIGDILFISCVNINLVNSQNRQTVINIRLEGRSPNTAPFFIDKKKVLSFHEAFFRLPSSSIFLKYKEDTLKTRYINNILWNDFVNQTDHLYFSCSNNKTSQNIECYRNVFCNSQIQMCVNGFGIYWAYEGEYIHSIYLKNTTFYCFDVRNVTCYTLLYQDDLTTGETSTIASTIKVNTDKILNSSNRIPLFTDHVTNYSLTSMSIYFTTQPANRFITTTLVPDNHNQTSALEVSTSVIAGVTVSIIIVIIIVILIFILCKKRKLKTESTSNNETQTVRLEMNSNTLNVNIYTHHAPSSDEHNNSQSTVCIQTNNGNFPHSINTNMNCFSDLSDHSKTAHTRPSSISDSDYKGIDNDQSSTIPGVLLSADQENDGYYNSIKDNRHSLVSRPITRVFKDNNCSNEGNYSEVNKEHPVSAQPEYATVNKNVGYRNFKEILQNKKTLVGVHEYNNVTDDNTTIGKNEPAKNVYSKLRENIRHFENTYGDLGLSVQTGEDNSSTR